MTVRVSTVVILLIVGSLGARAQSPTPVSPGGPTGMATVAGKCPTFHWTAVEGAESVNLMVYRVTEEEIGGEAEPVLSATLPGGANGWTPSLGQCLEPGGRYAWSVGAGSEWSEASLFEVSTAPSAAEVKEAMALLRRFLGAEEASAGSGEIGAPERRISQSGTARGEPWVRAGREGQMSAVQASAPTLSLSPSLVVDDQIHLGVSSDLFRDGKVFLWTDGTALSFSGTVALGLGALESTTGNNNAAVGHRALLENTTGSNNSAFGQLALDSNQTGSDNIAVGRDAGADLQCCGGAGSFSDNIFIGNKAESDDQNTIRIGDSSDHLRTFLAGQVAIGTSSAPGNQLKVEESINGDGNFETSYVVLGENPSTGTSPDVLALEVGRVNPGTASNFIGFFDGSGLIGQIEGDGGGGVQFDGSVVGPSSDFAEYMPKLEEDDQFGPGEVVGLYAGRVSHRTQDADRVMVVSTQPIVAGGASGAGGGIPVRAHRLPRTGACQRPRASRGRRPARGIRRRGWHRRGSAA